MIVALRLCTAPANALLLVAPVRGRREATRTTLELAGHRVWAVGDGARACAALRTGRIGAVLIDAAALDASTLALCGEICGEPAACGASIFLRVTQAGAAAAAVALGVHAVFRRPLEDEALGCLLAIVLGTEGLASPAWAGWTGA